MLKRCKFSLHLLYKYNNSLMLNWIGDGNMLFFWLFLKEYNIKLYNEIEKKVAINQKGDFMIERTKYLNQLINTKNNGFPKVITGIRRCGKSYLLKDIYTKYLKEECRVSDENILVVELDDDKNIELRNPIALGKYVREHCKGKIDCYVILDEIQKVLPIINPAFTNGQIILAKDGDENVITFVDVVLGLSREPNIDLYVTGSNSKMLSSDIVTEFRDKATRIHLSPLSFEEYANYKKGYAPEMINEYMTYGGMPLAVLEENEEERKNYLKGLFKTTYFSDILERNKLNKSEALDELCDIISDSVGGLINSERISNTYQSIKKETIDKDTVTKYINYFVDAFIIQEATRYDVKGRNEIGASRKYYFTDLGLRNARLNFSKPDDGHMLENIIFNELLYNGYSVNVGTYERVERNKDNKNVKKTYEIDFLATKGNRIFYVQVADDISKNETLEREKKPYSHLKDPIQKILVVNKPFKEMRDPEGYVLIGIADFLLNFIK